MFIHRENALKAHQHISYCSILVTLNNNFNIKLIKRFTKTHQIAHFLKNFSQGSMPPSMCAVEIIISVWKTFFHSECNQNIH